MTHYDDAYRANGQVFDPVREPELYDGVLSKRFFAFIIDAILIGFFLLLASLVILAMGVVTLGIAWFLFALPLFAIVALLYVALTLGGPKAATPGMRMAGVTIRSTDGERIGPIIAAAHALIFWFSVSVLTPLVLLVGLFSNRKRLLHDMLLGTVILNAGPLARTRR
ncbi:RDD family protein [Kaistia granuli]|uniref:RDD family protein n=1 Tax=Kaistia granuli TaxID=363259 RepID=UPI00035C6583|nr:RDD family protein [Kaistia granuli]